MNEIQFLASMGSSPKLRHAARSVLYDELVAKRVASASCWAILARDRTRLESLLEARTIRSCSLANPLIEAPDGIRIGTEEPARGSCG